MVDVRDEEAVKKLYEVAQRWKNSPPRVAREIHQDEVEPIMRAALLGWETAIELYEAVTGDLEDGPEQGE